MRRQVLVLRVLVESVDLLSMYSETFTAVVVEEHLLLGQVVQVVVAGREQVEPFIRRMGTTRVRTPGQVVVVAEEITTLMDDQEVREEVELSLCGTCPDGVELHSMVQNY